MNKCTCGSKCSCDIINKEDVNGIASFYNNNKAISNYQKILQLVAEPTKFKILLSLTQKEMCGCDLAFLTGVSTSNISHQMKILVDEKIVSKEKRGRMVYYEIVSPLALNLINGYIGKDI